MHSILIQLSKEPISEDAYIGEDNIENGEMVFIDYTYDTKADERTAFITTLVENVLPTGMFTLNAESNTLTYNGGFREWRKEYLSLVQAKTADNTTENIMEWAGPAYQLQKTIVNPLGTDILFVTEFAPGYALAERSREFMIMVSRLQKGEKLYIGSILGYHF